MLVERAAPTTTRMVLVHEDDVAHYQPPSMDTSVRTLYGDKDDINTFNVCAIFTAIAGTVHIDSLGHTGDLFNIRTLWRSEEVYLLCIGNHILTIFN